MSALSQHIDRLSTTTRAIATVTAHTATTIAGPYTRAVLTAPLGDLIRDIHPSELGLFTLPPPAHDLRTPASEIARAEFSGATPLRKHPHRRDDPSKSKDLDPETYAHAALKCIDR